MHVLIALASGRPTSVMPNNLVPEIVLSEHLIKNKFHLVTDMPVKVYVDRTSLSQKFAHEDDLGTIIAR